MNSVLFYQPGCSEVRTPLKDAPLGCISPWPSQFSGKDDIRGEKTTFRKRRSDKKTTLETKKTTSETKRQHFRQKDDIKVKKIQYSKHTTFEIIRRQYRRKDDILDKYKTTLEK